MVLARLHKHFLRCALPRKTSYRQCSVSASSIIEKWKAKFLQDHIPEVDESIKHILGHVLKTKKIEMTALSAIKLSKQQEQYFDQLCECRMARMPVQYILQEWDFRDLRLKMYPPVFIPRPETEELCDLILAQCNTESEMRFMDIGCGTGAISIALIKSLPLAKCVTIDQSKIACELTVHNAKKHNCQDRIKVLRHKLSKTSNSRSFGESFQLIVSNPPYVPKSQLSNLEPEIKLYEDLRALDGGLDGLDFIKIILSLAAVKLQQNGSLWLECDPSHPALIQEYLKDSKNMELQSLKFENSFIDMFGKERFVQIRKI